MSYYKASIIIITHNNLYYTKLCCESIFSKTQYPGYEVIIVDNASTDGTRNYFDELKKKHSNIHVILNRENIGFVRASNQGIQLSTGEIVVLLNNDTVVTKNWLERLIRYLQDEKTGMVGPVTSFCGNEARINVPYNTVTLDGFEDFVRQYHAEHKEPESFDIKTLAMYCVALRRKVIDEVGLLDELFNTGLFEDDDYCYRLKLKGYKLICAEDVFVHHFGEMTFGKLKKSGEYMKLFEKNKRRFEEKWGIKWEPHRFRESFMLSQRPLKDRMISNFKASLKRLVSYID
ncbi:MAG TPA: glycosyltransferase family 2 protein [Euryarchaeota archaeon]|nr:glycosyltransferase family 2 protein [Euryarchaeota archaeon]